MYENSQRVCYLCVVYVSNLPWAPISTKSIVTLTISLLVNYLLIFGEVNTFIIINIDIYKLIYAHELEKSETRTIHNPLRFQQTNLCRLGI